jgi:GTP-binding protein Era
MQRPDFRSGFAAIIGKPNTGKSTLMNRILGEKLSITSSKPQTTRYAIKGILNREDCQIVFIDTPGYLKPRYEMQQRMRKIWSDAFRDVDLVIFMSEVRGFPTEYDLEVLEVLKGVKSPLLAVFNKIDAEPGFDRQALESHLPSNVLEVHYVSALTGENVPRLVDGIVNHIPYHEPYYGEDQLSDLPLRFFAREVIREGIFRQFEQEIPYATAVLIERFTESPEKAVIDAVVWLERQSQKPILIGRNGESLKRIREYAETQLTAFLGQPVQIHLWVKVNPNWRKKSHALKELGFD